MTTELSTMYPENGGFVLWAKGAFGDAAGGMAGWMQFSFSAVDSALYPGLFVVYLSQTFQTEFGPEWTVWLQAGFIMLITGLNMAGIDSVGHGSMAMMLFLLLPFGLIVLIAFTGSFSGTTVTGWPFHIENLIQSVPNVSCLLHCTRFCLVAR
jgi:amino acid transporter